jgi:DNA-binding transcriptional LysR family regulator
MTDAGGEFYRHAVDTLQQAEQAENVIRHRLTGPSGTIKCAAAVATAQFAMRRMIGDFLVKYPKINIVEHVTDFLCSMRLTFVRPFRCRGRGSRPSTEQHHFMIS